jgi:NADH-quinone oxidoreductase subunit A
VGGEIIMLNDSLLDKYFMQYGIIAIFTAIAVAVPVSMMIISWILSLVKIRPNNPSDVKSSIYECGFETITERWNQFNFRYYSIALLFVIFDVEVVFLFPWAISYGVMSATFGTFIFFEMLVFISILLLGWVYAWKKGSLEWS